MKWVFDAKLGPLNRLIVAFGGEAQPWLFDPVLSVICIILLVSWQTLGYGVLIYLVGFRNLPKSVYEAARLDGANGVQSFFFMSVPLLKPITLYVSVVTLISGFNVYAQAFILASDTQFPAAWSACWFLICWRTASRTSVSDMRRPRR